MLFSKKKIIATITVILTILLNYIPIFAYDNNWTEAEKESLKWQQWVKEWEEIKNDWTQISLTPGKNESQLNLAWYSTKEVDKPKVRISKNSNMSDYKEFVGSQSNAVNGYKSNKVTVIGLEENTTYYYSYKNEGKWSKPVTYKTQLVDKFTFILTGDPQIGASLNQVGSSNNKIQGQDRAVRNDAFNWNDTLNKALSKSPNASFILSVGDQIQSVSKLNTGYEAMNYTENEIEYTGFLSQDILKSLPIATSIGNHDTTSSNYSYHFNNPNISNLGVTNAGSNYFFRYGSVLFIMLNTNNTNIKEHEIFLENTMKNNKDATWKIVTLHHDIYGPAMHSNRPYIVNLRYNLVPILEKNNIDVVLTGHDHAYSRSKILKGGKKNPDVFISDKEFEYNFKKERELGKLSTDKKYNTYLESIEDKDAIVTNLDIQDNKVVNPEGILYMTLNSSTGSKYYETVLRKQAYIEKRWQEYVPTFSTISIDDESFTINTYRTDNMNKIDKTYTIVKLKNIK